MNNFRCETCGRNMGDIDAPVCHECEQAEIDALAEQGLDRWGQPLEDMSIAQAVRAAANHVGLRLPI